jgi:integrase
MALSDTAVRNAKPRDRDYKISDALGLFLIVRTNGTKVWRLAYRFDRKQKTLALGRYPDVGLPAAREARLEARKLLARGVDPSARKQGIRSAKPGTRTLDVDAFETIGRQWFEAKKAKWVPGYADRILSRLEADVFPEIGQMRIKEVEPLDILAMLQKIEQRDAIDMAKRVRQYVGSIFRYGIALGRCSRNPSSDIIEALKAAPRARHRSALRFDELQDFFRALDAYDGQEQTRVAIELIMHTFVRTSELILARKSEFKDLDRAEQATWRIPAARMKMKREHVVPLTPQSITLVERLFALGDGSDWLLPSYTGRPISNNTMLFALYRMGYRHKATTHGFRTLASTSLNEAGFNRDWIERQLAHVPGDSVRAAYNAAEWLPDRRRMMLWWSEQLERQRKLAELLG